MGIYDDLIQKDKKKSEVMPSLSIYSDLIKTNKTPVQVKEKASPISTFPEIGIALQELTSGRAAKTFGSKVISNFVGGMTETAKYGFQQGVSAFSSMLDTWKGKDTTGRTAKDVTDLVNLTNGIATTLFSPASGIIQAGKGIPLVKPVAETTDLGFRLLGSAGSFAGGGILDLLPIESESKKILKQPIEELSSLAAQVYLGSIIMRRVGSYVENKTAVTPAIARKIVVESKSEVQRVPLNTKGTRWEKYAQEMGYEPYVPPSELPVIQAGKTPRRQDLPTIQTAVPEPSIPGTRLEPIREPIQFSQTPATIAPEGLKLPQVERKTPIAREPLTVSKTAFDIQTRMVAERMLQERGPLPPIERMRLTDQASLALEVINRDPVYAKKVAMGQAPAPAGVETGSIFTALREKAFQEGDVFTLTELSRSKAPTETAQALKSFDVFRSETDVVTALKEIRASRAAKLEEKGIKIEEAVKKEVAKQPKVEKVSPKTWDEFISSLEC